MSNMDEIKTPQFIKRHTKSKDTQISSELHYAIKAIAL